MRNLLLASCWCLLAAGCGATLVPVGVVAEMAGLPAGAFAPFTPGQKLALGVDSTPCPVGVTTNETEALSGRAAKGVREVFAADGPVALTVEQVSARVDPAPERQAVVARVVDATGRRHHLIISLGQDLGCMQPWSAQIDEALAMIGQRVAFAPTRPECGEIVVSGRAASSSLLDSDGEASFEARRVRLGASELGAYRARQPGVTPWLVLGDGELEVRADVVRQCFTAGARGALASGAQLQAAPGTCVPTKDDGQECRGTVGAWEGTVSDEGAHLVRRQRNLGPVRLLGKRPVTGVRFASTLVTVTTGRPGNARAAKLYEVVRGVVGTLSERAIDDVAVVVGDLPSAAFQIQVDVSGLTLGPLVESQTTGTAEFVARHEDQPNPAYAKAEADVHGAEAKASEAKATYDAGMQQYEVSKQQCEAAADGASQLTSNTWAQLFISAANVGCQIAAQPSMDDIVSSQAELAKAKAMLTQTPRTKRVPITETWTFPKKAFTRVAAAQLQLALRRADGAPTLSTLPVRYQWEDFEVTADAAHNVPGHTPDPQALRDAEALIPGLGREVATTLTRALDETVATSTLEAARAKLAAASETSLDVQDQRVDAVAFAATRERLLTNVRRGRSELSGGAVSVALDTKKLAADQCLLLAAAPDEDRGAALTLRSADGYWADERGATPAYLELCPSPGHPLPSSASIASPTRGWVRWGVYVTKRWPAEQAPQVN